MGGISEALRVYALAAASNIPVFPHVFPEIHVHLAAGLSGVLAVEMTDPKYEIESLYRLFSKWVTVADGLMTAPEDPGLGVTLNRDALEQYATQTAV
jgi:L-alanine-DL-glutamate epimerase-like enolase superfamily enzyme